MSMIHRVVPDYRQINRHERLPDQAEMISNIATGTTPPIPDWIREYRTSSYTNIYELVPDETRLYGTESLYGDWSGELLLLAKDFAERSYITKRIEAGDPQPFRHAAEFRTNKNLIAYATPINCGILYGSALVGLLRNDNSRSGSLPDRRTVWPFACEALRFTVDQMPNLRAIACLGGDSWECATESMCIPASTFREHRENRIPVKADGISIFAIPHPSRYPGGKSKVVGDWNSMCDLMGFV